jgi:hypothetical protein
MDLSVPRKKSPVTRPEIDPGTFRLVAQRLNYYATPGLMELGLGVIYHLKCVNFMSFWILHIFVGTLSSSEANTSHILQTSGCQTGVKRGAGGRGRGRGRGRGIGPMFHKHYSAVWRQTAVEICCY